MRTALVDGDVVVYIMGFATEEVWYETSDGTILPTMGKAKEYAKTNDDCEILRLVEAEPKTHALHLVKNLMNKIRAKTGAKDIRVFLSGKDNFRNDVATIRPYKGNRPSIKPFHYNAIREYLIDKWGAEVSVGMEADDLLGIHANEDSVICTIDKDLDMVPGMHYNFQKEELYSVTEYRALRSFYIQLLKGDPVDNIVGVPRVGKKTAERIISKCKDEEDMYWAALCGYSKAYPKPYEALVENARLLWILREEDQIWTPQW
jgi:hypothetical protein